MPDPEQNSLTPAILSAIEPSRVIDLTLALGQINSPPGSELEIAEFVLDWLAENNIPAQKQQVLPGRCNAIGRLQGEGAGPSLILNSHLDTAYGDPMDVWTAGKLTQADMSAWEDADRIYGQGVVNDKAPMAATLVAMKALKDLGVSLKGDLIFTGVAGEIGHAPIDEFQGSRYEGKGIGTRYAVTHGIVADYALVAECTNWTYTTVECGCLLIKISLPGKAIYTPFLTRPQDPAQHPNAIIQAGRVMEAFESWAQVYEEQNSYRAATGMVVPKASIGAIRGGLPYKPIETAGICALYIDVRLPPPLSPLVPIREIEALVRKLSPEATVEPYLFRRGYEGRHVEPLQEAIGKAHQVLFQDQPGEAEPPVNSMWRDLNVFNEVGIPALTYGPPLGLSSQGWTYYILKEELVRATQIYALIAHDVCGGSR